MEKFSVFAKPKTIHFRMETNRTTKFPKRNFLSQSSRRKVKQSISFAFVWFIIVSLFFPLHWFEFNLYEKLQLKCKQTVSKKKYSQNWRSFVFTPPTRVCVCKCLLPRQMRHRQRVMVRELKRLYSNQTSVEINFEEVPSHQCIQKTYREQNALRRDSTE